MRSFERELATHLAALAEIAGHEIAPEQLEPFEYSVECQQLGRAA